MPPAGAQAIDLHYLDAGQGEPIVLVHGLGASSLDWDQQIPAFSDRYRLVAPDLRGFGRSRTLPGPHSISTFADDLHALLDRLGIERAHLVGHSMGGAVAFQAAVDQPGRWASLCVVNSQASFRPRSFGHRFQVMLRRVMVTLFGLPRLAGLTAKRLFPAPEQVEVRERIRERYADNDGHIYLEVLASMTEWDVRPRLDRIACPALVVVSEFDYFPLADTRSWLDLLPDASLEVVPGVRHALPEERPEAFNALLDNFLASDRVRAAFARPRS